jgi:aspartate aminotransferase
MIDSVSKRYSACGARIGVLVTKNKEVYNTAMKFAQARLSPSTLGQILSEALVDTTKSYFEEVKFEYDNRRQLVINRLNKMTGVVAPIPNGAFYAFIKLPIDDSDKFCQWLLEEFVNDGATVMLAPATGFYSTEGAGIDEVRLAYVLNLDDLSVYVANRKNDLSNVKEYKRLYEKLIIEIDKYKKTPH